MKVYIKCSHAYCINDGKGYIAMLEFVNYGEIYYTETGCYGGSKFLNLNTNLSFYLIAIT